jgi:hypothetical protein
MTREQTQRVAGIASQALDPVDGVTAHRQFVINLCTLATPITVPQPRASRLARYSFFLSRCTVNGQRQYRLHMGYFASTTEAERWLTTLKRIYPGAHVGGAPDTQPELMSDTQRLRILNVGQVDKDNSEVHDTATTQSRRAAVELPASRELFVRDTGSAPVASRRKNPSLEDTLDDLRTSEFDMGTEDDDLNATGVRHLRIDKLRDGAVAPVPQRAGTRVRR